MKMLEKDPLADEMAEQEFLPITEETIGLTSQVLKSLSEPFPEDEIGWKAQAYNKDKTRALAVPHLTARHVMNRLDEVVGPANWTTDFEFIPGIKAAKVMLTVFGITKCDIGFVAGRETGVDDDAAIKGSVSDGLKRAAVLFGIGRYLYEAERQWVGWDAKKRKFAETPKLILKNGPKPGKAKRAKKPKEIRGSDPWPSGGDRPQEPKPKPTREKVTVGLIEQEANAQLQAMGYKPHYKNRPHTIKAMESCGYKGTATKYLTENFIDIVACLIDRRVAERAEREESE